MKNCEIEWIINEIINEEKKYMNINISKWIKSMTDKKKEKRNMWRKKVVIQNSK